MSETMKLLHAWGRSTERAIGSCLLALVVLLLGLIPLGCGRSGPFQPDAAELAEHNRAVALMGQFNYEAAWETLEPLATKHPEWLDVQVDWAIATLNRRQAGDGDLAVKLLRDVAQKDPKNLRALYCEAILRLDGGDPEAARQLFERVADGDPQDAYAQYYAGQCLSQVGRVEESLARFEKAIPLDPYLRSTYYGAFQACLRLGKTQQADGYRQAFERLEKNPQSRLAEIKYTRMGPKASLQAVGGQGQTAARPAGDLFAAPVDLALGNPPWRSGFSPTDRPHLTVADLREGGPQVLFAARASSDEQRPNVILRATKTGWEWWADHPLSAVPDVLSVLWGDYDNDGLVDAYLCRSGPNQLWRQTAPDQWEDVTESTGTSGGDLVTRDGQFFDADHDGDLDLFLANEGASELLSNNLNGTFRPLAAEQGLQGSGGPSRAVVVADLDRDRDLDILVVKENTPHEVYLNDRLWVYRAAEGMNELCNTPAKSVVATDWDVDGQSEIWMWTEQGLVQWTPDPAGQWRSQPVSLEAGDAGTADASPEDTTFAFADIDGDGRLDLVRHGASGWGVWDLASRKRLSGTAESSRAWRLVNRPETGPAMVTLGDGRAAWHSAGDGRFKFLTVAFTGKEEQADQMRSNRSGIGVLAAARRGGQWTPLRTLRSASLPGQDLQPLAVGLGGQDRLDFVSVTWPDGVYQTEFDLDAGKLHTVTETQRQVASCPLIFTWDGSRYAFITDVLGGGGIGFNVGRGEYGEPRSIENLLLPRGSLSVRDGAYHIKVAEPMEEVCYLDAARLVRYELPAGWQMTLDERFAVQGPMPTGEPVFYRRLLQPVAAVNDRGESVMREVQDADGDAVEPGKRDVRFIGRTDRHEVELQFAEPLESGDAYLLMDGWIEYPYSQTMFAAWQAGATYEAPTIEACDAEGTWHEVSPAFGYPAGMPRQAVVPLSRDRLPPDTRRLRISSTMEIYWDRLAVIFRETPPAVRRDAFPLKSATVADVGYAPRTLLSQRRPVYDYERRTPFGDSRHLCGLYTEFGPVRDLVAEVDDRCAIIGPGEEVHLEFDAQPLAGIVSDDLGAVWVLELNGWCKDMDLYTRDGETVDPLPRRAAQEAGSSPAPPVPPEDNRRWRYRGGA